MVQFEVYGIPKGKGRPKFAKIGNFMRAYSPADTVSYENLIKLSYKQASNIYIENEPIAMTIIAVFMIPQSWSNKKRERALQGSIKPTVKPDTDNIAKVVADALNGVAYADDKQICKLVIEKTYGIEPKLNIGISKLGESK